MNTNVYQTPEAQLLDTTELSRPEYYVISKKKMAILFIATLGFFAVWWFYVNWRNYRDANQENLWPVPRSIFYIFFTHSLFANVEFSLEQKELDYKWSPSLLASGFVFIAILTRVLDRLSLEGVGSPITDILSVLSLPLSLLILLKAQGAINLSQDDAEGKSNSHFTAYNIIWVILGSLFWLMLAIGLLSVFGVIPA